MVPVAEDGSAACILIRPKSETEADRFWERMNLVPDRDLWAAHMQQKAQLQEYARIRLRRQLARHGEAPDTLAELGDILDPEVLTIGFARRMATYKRAALVFSDLERLEQHGVAQPHVDGEVEGEAGDFRITLVKKPRYIIEEKCTGCGTCTSVPQSNGWRRR